ncbi:uracil-DNA glycosylase [Pseudoneobacillus sp. C159]
MSNFCPVLWPEDPTPDGQNDCMECGLYKHGSRMIWGEGNPKASILVLLDNPGARENREGNPFVCGTRQALQEAAYLVGLSVEDLYITYILKRRPVRAYDKDQVRQTCMVHLELQLQTMQPELVLCLGNVAVQAFFHNPEAEVKELRGFIHQVQGFPTAVAYHPLAVRRRPNLWNLFLEDWQLVANKVSQSLPTKLTGGG